MFLAIVFAKQQHITKQRFSIKLWACTARDLNIEWFELNWYDIISLVNFPDAVFLQKLVNGDLLDKVMVHISNWIFTDSYKTNFLNNFDTPCHRLEKKMIHATIHRQSVSFTNVKWKPSLETWKPIEVGSALYFAKNISKRLRQKCKGP